ncbi:MAG TPA: EthD family reductase [Candidatus Eisenbacteria bacterium]|nr:EthD family reductase [Candidatus Eisenbacteria bacterium]
MVKVTVFYPNGPGAHFEMAYYCTKHMPLVQRLLGRAVKKIAVEEGLAGGAPGTAATYIAMGHLYFDSVEDFLQAWAPHAEEIVADVPKYTNVEPLIQISAVKL